MHPKSAPRRRHDAEIKAKVLAACHEPGASIAAVALAHGLNANLVRKWRHGRGLKRTGIAVSSSVVPTAPVVSPVVAAPPLLMAEARFLPIEMSRPGAASNTGSADRVDTAARCEATRMPNSLASWWCAPTPSMWRRRTLTLSRVYCKWTSAPDKIYFAEEARAMVMDLLSR